MSPRPSPCDGFTGQLPAYADRELGTAESTAVERHLEACGSCQGRLKEIESVGDVLKGWDARSPAGGTAAARLQHAVLARIQEDSLRRRRELRVLRVKRLALAASVLVAVGLPLALGVAARRRAAREPETSYVVAQGEPHRTPALDAAREDLSLPGRAPAPFAPWDRTVAAAEVAGPSPEQRDGLLRAGLEAQKALLLEQQFRTTFGADGVWVVDPANGYRLLMTPEAAHRLEVVRHEDAVLRSRTSAARPPPRSLRRSAGDLLHPVLQGDEGTEAWRGRLRGWPVLIQGRPAFTAWPLARRDEGGASALLETLDPVKAQDLRLLRLEPSGYDVDTVVAIVEAGTELPILLPAGHLLTGGVTDRVVTASTWLPASPKQRSVVKVPCAVVRSGSPRAEGGIRLTPWVAGPSLRALLAEGASAEAVLAHARALRGLRHGRGLEWSLLDLYDERRERAVLEHPEFAKFAAQAAAGFVAIDEFGRLLGLDHVALAGPSGMLLVQRLLHGYTKEAIWRRVNGPQVLAIPGEPAGPALARVRTTTTPLQVPPVPPDFEADDVERATFSAEDPDERLALEALRVTGTTASVSLLPRPARP